MASTTRRRASFIVSRSLISLACSRMLSLSQDRNLSTSALRVACSSSSLTSPLATAVQGPPPGCAASSFTVSSRTVPQSITVVMGSPSQSLPTLFLRVSLLQEGDPYRPLPYLAGAGAMTNECRTAWPSVQSFLQLVLHRGLLGRRISTAQSHR